MLFKTKQHTVSCLTTPCKKTSLVFFTEKFAQNNFKVQYSFQAFIIAYANQCRQRKRFLVKDQMTGLNPDGW